MIVLIVLIIAILQHDQGEPQEVLNTILPVIGTWIGTILAFYYGSNNLKVASENYQQMLNRLSPEVLDDITVNQVMITTKTMVSKRWNEIKDKPVSQILSFLQEVDKTRLPILDQQGNVKYIVHKALLLGVANDGEDPTQSMQIKMNEFVQKHQGIVDNILKVNISDKLEVARDLLKDNTGIQDVFVYEKESLRGWLTNTLILRFIAQN